jgi:hypothetical protein
VGAASLRSWCGRAVGTAGEALFVPPGRHLGCALLAGGEVAGLASAEGAGDHEQSEDEH